MSQDPPTDEAPELDAAFFAGATLTRPGENLIAPLAKPTSDISCGTPQCRKARVDSSLYCYDCGIAIESMTYDEKIPSAEDGTRKVVTNMADEKRFTLDLTLNVTLTLSQIWPDGDAPENPTAADVIAVLKEESPFSPLEALSEWNLENDCMLIVMPVGKPSEREIW